MFRLLAITVVCMSLAGCEAIALTALGVGASTGVSHNMNGMTYRTFTASRSKVKSAALAALNSMEIKVNGTEKIDLGEVIKATSADRDIEVELESISSKTTRMRVTAKRNLFISDSATATEIILQTEKYM